MCWVCGYACGDQRTSFRSWFSSSIIWVLGIELRSPDLVASPLTCWALSVVLQCLCVIPCLSLLWRSKDSLSALPFLCSKAAEWRHKGTLSFMRCSQLSSRCFTYWCSPQKAASSPEPGLKDLPVGRVKHYLFTASVCPYWQTEPAFVFFYCWAFFWNAPIYVLGPFL